MNDPRQSPGVEDPGSPGRYLLERRSSQHRPRSRRLITWAAALAAPRRAVVLGAGECDEIPLHDIVARYEQVTLNDLEPALLERALDQAALDANARTKIGTCIADLTGVTEPLIAGVERALENAATAAAAIEAMAAVVERPQPHNFPPALAGPFVLVVASCVLSQLHFALVHRSGVLFEQRFPGQIEALRGSPCWTSAIYTLARTVEANFIADLANITPPDGIVYLSESVQMCYLQATADGKWRSEGTYRMLQTTELADYLDERFQVLARDRWEWVVAPPVVATQTGRLYDVQAIVARRIATSQIKARPS